MSTEPKDVSVNGLQSELRTLHERIAKSPEKSEDDRISRGIDELKTRVIETTFVEEARRELGNALIAITICRDYFSATDDSIEKEDLEPAIVVLTTDIKIEDKAVTDFLSRPCFSYDAPIECLRGDLGLEELRLSLCNDLDEELIRRFFREIQRAYKRKDLNGASVSVLHGIIAQSGGSEDAFVGGMLRQLSERQKTLDRREGWEQVKQGLLQREIAHRRSKLRQAAKALGGIETPVCSIHLDVLRSKLFDGHSKIVQELMDGLLFDRGLVGRLAAALDHKERVQIKFEDNKYFVGYAIFGSWITRQETAGETADMDCFVLIDDFDVKTMTRSELSTKLRVIVDAMAKETAMESGLPGLQLHCTTCLLTEAWQAIYEGDVVLLSILDQAFVIYDPRSLIRSWQILLHNGQIAPSRSAASRLLESARQNVFYPHRRIREAIHEDLYPGVLAAAQSVLVRLGEKVLPPDTVIEKLRWYCAAGSNGFSTKQDLKEIRSCLQDLVTLMRVLKKQPSARIGGRRLAVLMKRAQRSFEIAEQICVKLGDSRLQVKTRSSDDSKSEVHSPN